MRQFKRDLLEEHRELVTLGAVTPDALVPILESWRVDPVEIIRT